MTRHEYAADTAIPAQFDQEEARNMTTSCELNIAFCHIKMGDYTRACDACDRVISREPSNAKVIIPPSYGTFCSAMLMFRWFLRRRGIVRDAPRRSTEEILTSQRVRSKRRSSSPQAIRWASS